MCRDGGQGNLVSGLIVGITEIIMWFIRVISYKYTYQVAMSLLDHFKESFRNEESVIPRFGRFQLLMDPYNHQNEHQVITGVQSPHTSAT